MKFSDQRNDESPKNDTKDDKEPNFRYFHALREKYDIHVNKDKYMNYYDYVKSLDINLDLYSTVQNKKIASAPPVYFFEIEMMNGSIEKSTLKWTIRRRFKDFVYFEKKLSEELEEAKVPSSEIPQLSSLYDMQSEENPERFIEAAETYLRNLMATPDVRAKSTVLFEFIELSLLPLPNGPQKFKEGYLKKKGGGRFKHNKFKIYCSMIFTHWQERWFILTEEGIIYTISSDSTRAREMLLFDQSFQIEYGRKATGSKEGLSLITPNRRLNLKAKNLFEALDWIGEIQKAAKASPYTKVNRYLSFAPVREPIHYCKWYIDAEGYFEDLYDALVQAKREVFITDWWLSPEIVLKRPVKDGESEYRLDKVLGRIANSGVKVYVIVYHEIRLMMYNDSEHSKRSLQSLSPNIIVLKHPSEPFFSWSHHAKLVVVDQTVGFIGGLDLCFGRMDLNSHPLVDPAYVEGKGEVTFFGQDYANPRLVDFRKVKEQGGVSLIDKETTPRMPFHDAMIKVIGPAVGDMSRHFTQFWNHVTVDCYAKEEQAPLPKNSVIPPQNKATQIKENATVKLRSAFRKIIGMKYLGEALGTPMGLNTNDVNTQEEDQEMQKIPSTMTSLGGAEENIGSMKSINNNDNEKFHERARYPKCKEEEKEEQNVELNESFDESLIDLKTKDEQNLKQKEREIQNNEDLGKIRKTLYLLKNKGNFIMDRINHIWANHVRIPFFSRKKAQGEPTKEETIKNEINDNDDDDDKEYSNRYLKLWQRIREKEEQYQHDLEMSDSVKKPKLRRHKHLKAKLESEEKFIKTNTDQFYEKNMLHLLFSPKPAILEGTIACQMLRSAAKWSLGLNSNDGNVECSIQNAYIELIKNAKRFIYIENQFFMSGTAGKALNNGVAEALLYRIERAHRRREKFRVLVFLPLIHAFEGEIIDSKSTLLRLQLHWQYMTICRGGSSIYEQLKAKGIKPEDYIQFYSLRQHTKMPNGTPVTEMIYIHSKILVIDDDILLIGSANINDRSLQGNRDSEIAMIFEDKKKVTTTMNGKEIHVSEFSHTFRKRLLAEHLGLSEDEVKDPLTDEFISIMNQRAENNTLIYREIFACYPDDNMRTLKDIDELGKKKNLEKYDELVPKIQGHIVWYPLDFLCDEQLTPSMTNMEYYISDQTFV